MSECGKETVVSSSSTVQHVHTPKLQQQKSNYHCCTFFGATAFASEEGVSYPEQLKNKK